nr:MAG: wsv260-like protein [Marsupenaeus japonicus pemonivirus]
MEVADNQGGKTEATTPRAGNTRLESPRRSRGRRQQASLSRQGRSTHNDRQAGETSSTPTLEELEQIARNVVHSRLIPDDQKSYAAIMDIEDDPSGNIVNICSDCITFMASMVPEPELVVSPPDPAATNDGATTANGGVDTRQAIPLTDKYRYHLVENFLRSLELQASDVCHLDSFINDSRDQRTNKVISSLPTNVVVDIAQVYRRPDLMKKTFGDDVYASLMSRGMIIDYGNSSAGSDSWSPLLKYTNETHGDMMIRNVPEGCDNCQCFQRDIDSEYRSRTSKILSALVSGKCEPELSLGLQDPEYRLKSLGISCLDDTDRAKCGPSPVSNTVEESDDEYLSECSVDLGGDTDKDNDEESSQDEAMNVDEKNDRLNDEVRNDSDTTSTASTIPFVDMEKEDMMGKTNGDTLAVSGNDIEKDEEKDLAIKTEEYNRNKKTSYDIRKDQNEDTFAPLGNAIEKDDEKDLGIDKTEEDNSNKEHITLFDTEPKKWKVLSKIGHPVTCLNICKHITACPIRRINEERFRSAVDIRVNEVTRHNSDTATPEDAGGIQMSWRLEMKPNHILAFSANADMLTATLIPKPSSLGGRHGIDVKADKTREVDISNLLIKENLPGNLSLPLMNGRNLPSVTSRLCVHTVISTSMQLPQSDGIFQTEDGMKFTRTWRNAIPATYTGIPITDDTVNWRSVMYTQTTKTEALRVARFSPVQIVSDLYSDTTLKYRERDIYNSGRYSDVEVVGLSVPRYNGGEPGIYWINENDISGLNRKKVRMELDTALEERNRHMEEITNRAKYVTEKMFGAALTRHDNTIRNRNRIVRANNGKNQNGISDAESEVARSEKVITSLAIHTQILNQQSKQVKLNVSKLTNNARISSMIF